jgi:hypothetical protein
MILKRNAITVEALGFQTQTIRVLMSESGQKMISHRVTTILFGIKDNTGLEITLMKWRCI